MKLKTEFQDENFKLGEVADVNIATMPDGRIKAQAVAKSGGVHTFFYDDFKTFTDDWEDVPEEPKEYWYISDFGYVFNHEINNKSVKSTIEEMKLIGNYFESKEEAEKAVEKLKALTKLCKKGFEFNSVEMFGGGLIRIEASIPINEKTTLQERSNITDSLYLLFGGEE